MVGPDKYSVERLEERPWLKVVLLCYREDRVLEIILVVARIDDSCQLKDSLLLSVFDPYDTSGYRFDLFCPFDSLLKALLKTLVVGIYLVTVAGQPLDDEFLLLILRGYFD